MDIKDVPEFASRTRNLPGNVLVVQNFDVPFPGITDPYLYLGERGSMFALHTEDENSWSVNYLHRGEKLWYIIPPSQQAELETFFTWVSKIDPDIAHAPTCSQVSPSPSNEKASFLLMSSSSSDT